MKEIDFLPVWYINSRRREVNYRMQYIVLSGIFAVMIVWNFLTAGSLSKAQAQLKKMETKQSQSESVSARLSELKNEIAQFHKKELLADSIDSRINVYSVLAEVSFLVNEKIVLRKLELLSEKFTSDRNNEQARQAGSVVRVTDSSFTGNNGMPLGKVRFKVRITGVAANASDVAVLICRLEGSPYFCQVSPSYTRSREIDIKNRNSTIQSQEDSDVSQLQNKRIIQDTKEKIMVSEFEINCYLANYREI